jgi:hypothetical protein
MLCWLPALGRQGSVSIPLCTDRICSWLAYGWLVARRTTHRGAGSQGPQKRSSRWPASLCRHFLAGGTQQPYHHPLSQLLASHILLFRVLRRYSEPEAQGNRKINLSQTQPDATTPAPLGGYRRRLFVDLERRDGGGRGRAAARGSACHARRKAGHIPSLSGIAQKRQKAFHAVKWACYTAAPNLN